MSTIHIILHMTIFYTALISAKLQVYNPVFGHSLCLQSFSWLSSMYPVPLLDPPPTCPMIDCSQCPMFSMQSFGPLFDHPFHCLQFGHSLHSLQFGHSLHSPQMATLYTVCSLATLFIHRLFVGCPVSSPPV